MFHAWPRLYLELAAKLGSLKSHSGRTGFEGMTEAWRAAESWPLVRCSLNSCGKAQVWRAHAERLKLEWRSYWWSAAQLQYNPQQDGDASTMGRAPRTAALEWILPHVRRQAVCAAAGGAGEVTHALWKVPEEHEWIPDSWALLPSDCDCSFPLEVRTSLIYFTEAHSWDFWVLKRVNF